MKWLLVIGVILGIPAFWFLGVLLRKRKLYDFDGIAEHIGGLVDSGLTGRCMVVTHKPTSKSLHLMRWDISDASCRIDIVLQSRHFSASFFEDVFDRAKTIRPQTICRKVHVDRVTDSIEVSVIIQDDDDLMHVCLITASLLEAQELPDECEYTLKAFGGVKNQPGRRRFRWST